MVDLNLRIATIVTILGMTAVMMVESKVVLKAV